MRELILSKEEYTEEEWCEIEAYVRDDVLCDHPLLTNLASTIDLPRGIVPRSLRQGSRRYEVPRPPYQHRVCG